ncbi:MAG: hypothetical protein K0S54_3056 [Alphaproteobacteria bacterium]|jgi:hypothetical protein|nr:hypothetical protein [Alphaproteobacteria bacterium]
MTDFSRLRLRANRRQYLVAPAGHTADAPHRRAPIFAIPVHKLASDFRLHALDQPGVLLKEVSIDGRKLELAHRTGLLRITTWISAQFLPVDESRSTLAVYSRTRYGSRTTNQQRIDSWLAALGAAKEETEPAEVQLDASPASA